MSAREKAKGRSVAAPGANSTVNTVTRMQQVLQGIFTETFTPGLSSKAGIDEMDLAFFFFFFFLLHILHPFHTNQLYI